jgi:DNA polymerase III subunit epsilon
MAYHDQPLTDAEFIAFDLETTGLHPVAAQIVEIAAVRFRGDGQVLGQFEQLVNPQCDIPARVTEIHGITNQMVLDQPTIARALPALVEFLGDTAAVMLAHNAGFDVGFLSVAFSRLRQPAPKYPVLDTCVLARRRLSLSNYKLETIGRHLHLIDVEMHRALDDTILLKDVFLDLVGRAPAIVDTGQLFGLAPQLTFESFAALLENPPAGYEDLWAAIGEEQPVEIAYLGGTTPGVTRVITPRGVMQLGGRIYLSAYCHESDCDKTFRLDRIASYRRRTAFDR